MKWDALIEDVYLFGSFARGEADADSDVDILVISREKNDEINNELKQKISEEWKIPVAWISLYTREKILEMVQKGSYFLWHIKLEGIELFSKEGFLERQLKELPLYKGALQDLQDYSVICEDIRQQVEMPWIDVNYELSVLASIIRNTCITIAYLYGEMKFGRVSPIETCNKYLRGVINIPIEQYKALYNNRLYITNKRKERPIAGINDIQIWVEIAERLIAIGKEIYHAGKDN